MLELVLRTPTHTPLTFVDMKLEKVSLSVGTAPRMKRKNAPNKAPREQNAEKPEDILTSAGGREGKDAHMEMGTATAGTNAHTFAAA
mmetsp:Transcript_51443/g.111994  ORF Transcript_51443/g.111994 Transcript_51443/m.111994 type:complete len:87 (-) Transcript_51443:35-295(-)